MEEYTFFPTETQVLSCFSVAHMGHRNKCFFRSFFKRSKSKAFSLQVKCPNAMTDLAPFPPLYAIHHYFCVWSKKCIVTKVQKKIQDMHCCDSNPSMNFFPRIFSYFNKMKIWAENWELKKGFSSFFRYFHCQ